MVTRFKDARTPAKMRHFRELALGAKDRILAGHSKDC